MIKPWNLENLIMKVTAGTCYMHITVFVPNKNGLVNFWLHFLPQQSHYVNLIILTISPGSWLLSNHEKCPSTCGLDVYLSLLFFLCVCCAQPELFKFPKRHLPSNQHLCFRPMCLYVWLEKGDVEPLPLLIKIKRRRRGRGGVGGGRGIERKRERQGGRGRDGRGAPLV